MDEKKVLIANLYALTDLKELCEEIQGQWDGNESGEGEDRANAATDIIRQVDILKPLIKEMQGE